MVPDTVYVKICWLHYTVINNQSLEHNELLSKCVFVGGFPLHNRPLVFTFFLIISNATKSTVPNCSDSYWAST